MYDKDIQSNEKCLFTFPGKLHHPKCRENKKCSCFCDKLFDFTHTEGLSMSNCDLQCNSKQRKNYLESVEKATQIEINTKNIYDAFFLEGFVNANSGINETYSDRVLSDRESLSDIKKILVTTNDKLDLILKALTERNNHRLKEQNKQKKRLRSKTTSALTLPIQNGLSDLRNILKPQLNCISATCIPKLRSKECHGSNLFYVSPYNGPYYMYGRNMNYLKKFGWNCSEKHPSNVWNPFIFMATNINTHKFKLGNNNDKITPYYNKNNNEEEIDKESLNFNASMEQLYSDQD